MKSDVAQPALEEAGRGRAWTEIRRACRETGVVRDRNAPKLRRGPECVSLGTSSTWPLHDDSAVPDSQVGFLNVEQSIANINYHSLVL